MGITNAEATLFGGVLLFAFAAGLARTLRNGNYRSPMHSLAIASVSSFLGFSVCGVAFDQAYENYWFAWAVATAVGLLGREFTDKIILALLRKIGIYDDET